VSFTLFDINVNEVSVWTLDEGSATEKFCLGDGRGQVALSSADPNPI